MHTTHTSALNSSQLRSFDEVFAHAKAFMIDSTAGDPWNWHRRHGKTGSSRALDECVASDTFHDDSCLRDAVEGSLKQWAADYERGTSDFELTVQAATTLTELSTALNALLEHCNQRGALFDSLHIDHTGLPSFGGDVPESMRGIYSYDEDRVLIRHWFDHAGPTEFYVTSREILPLAPMSDDEEKVLVSLVHHDYIERGDECYVTETGASKRPHGLSQRAVDGILGTLDEKDLVDVFDEGDQSTVRLTKRGIMHAVMRDKGTAGDATITAEVA